MELINLSISSIKQGLANKDFSAKEITQAHLACIKKIDQEIHSFLEVSSDLALHQAKDIDKKISQGKKIGELGGVPCSVKDAIMVEGLKCTAGSRILENYTAVYDATCVKKLKQAGAVILGKTNLDEFAMGSSTERSAFKITKNPRDLTRVPGGSSGGSAASVAGDEAVFSLGSDTGGSVRQPASFCGVVGLKPTYGAVSRYGLIAFASSLDQIGPIAKTADDCQAVFNAIAGVDEKDATSRQFSIFNDQFPNNFQLSNVKIGIPKEYFGEGLNPEVKKAVEGAIKKLETQGAKIEEISLPHSRYGLACYYIIATSEASANLARFDGVRYGLSQQGDDLLACYLKTRGEGFGEEVKRRIILGTFCLSSGYYDAYYLKAQKVRQLIRQDFLKAFEKTDFIFTPTSPFTAFKIGEKMDDPLQMYLADIYTISLNLAGLPGLSMPCGADKNNLPIGLQIIGPHFSEPRIFQVAKTLEKLV